MKFPLSWLKEFVDITMPVEQLERRLTLSGMEVVNIQYIGVEGGELPWDAEKIVIGNILEVTQHPNADRLVLAVVDYGAAEPHTVVTGAPNLFPYKGQGRLPHPLKAVYAKEGARLYDGHAEGKVISTLKGRPVRGVMSDAMLCSEKELGISEEHDGIIFLEDDAPVGTPLRDYFGDVVLEIDFTPNYARCLSIVGLAREIAALTGATLRLPDVAVSAEGAPITGRAHVTIAEPDYCPRFTLGLIEGVRIGPSPQWMQRRLTLAGMRPINNIVDVSNYVMLEWGQPTHTFDADCVADQHVIVRFAKAGERLTTLDGKERDLQISDSRIDVEGETLGGTRRPVLCVCDSSGPLALAGVMGGEESEVRETTTRILLEAAIWEPVQIRRVARALKLPSEASRRFERGVDYELPLIAQRRALELIRESAGGTVAAGLIDDYPRPWQTVDLDLTPREVERIVGVRLSAPEIAQLLTSLGFDCELRGGAGLGDFATTDSSYVHVTVPSFRQDVTMLADLCEEVARVYGYERIPDTRLADELPPSDEHSDLILEKRVRALLVAAGASEIITHSMLDLAMVGLVEPSAARAELYARIANPSTPERVYMRRSLLPSLLTTLELNLRERQRALIFEVGRVYLPTERFIGWQNGEPGAAWGAADVLPDEPRRVAIATAGPREVENWQGGDQSTLDYYDLKGIIEQVLKRLGLDERASYVPLSDDERFHPGRAAALLIERQISSDTQGRPEQNGSGPTIGNVQIISERAGVFGELHPLVRERLGLNVERAVAAELDLELLIAAAQPARYDAISRFPATTQDLAIIAANDIPAAQIEAIIRKGAGALLESLTLFDIYSGPQVGEGKRSLAYHLSFRAADRTLSDETLAKLRVKIIKLLEREAGASIRG
jgi:phenylalanyl-tRNA synthetase beta chain